MLKRIFRFFSKPRVLSLFNLLLIAILIAGNSYWPVACNPSVWAAIVLVICFLSAISYPIVKNRGLSLLLSGINGVSCFIFVYFILFISYMNAYGFLFIIVGIGLLAFIPHFFLGQLIRNYLIKPKSKASKRLFLTGIASSLLLMLYSGVIYHRASNALIEDQQESFVSVERSFMVEKILGMHFIYHTRFCPWDGWRPPIHEPLMVMGMWLNGSSPFESAREADPINLSLEERIELYKRVYPEKQIKFDCACSYEDHRAYHQDEIWD